jgi:hypothetical protein
MKTTLLLILTCFGWVSAGAATTGIYRKTLDKPTAIQGYPCAKGYAWFYPDGKLESCAVSQETQFGEALLPRGSIISLGRDGRPEDAMMQHDAVVAGVKCSGGNWLLGPSEGAVTAFFPSGKLKLCFLPEDKAVQGVPCARGTFWTAIAGHDEPVEFYEDGRLRSCGLAEDFGGQKKNTIWKIESKP